CDLHHAVAGVGSRPRGILRRRDAEEHHRGDPEVGERPHLLAQALLGVLEHARHRRHRFGRVDPFLHEEGRDQIVDVDACLTDAQSEARVGCRVIDGAPKLDDGRPYVDYYGDTTRCAGLTASEQNRLLATQHPDTIVWLSGWESWPNRELDGQLMHFGTIAGN